MDHHHEHGHKHHHEHGEHCGCGCTEHGHGHVHGEHCGCGHDHIEIPPAEGMTILQQNMLLALHERRYLPVARFLLTKSDEEEVVMTALAPVYLGSAQDGMDDVKALGAQLQGLEDMDLLSLDYDLPLGGYPYAEYTDSALYAYFAQTVADGVGKPGFVFDTPRLELGSMALTERGEAAVQAMLDGAK